MITAPIDIAARAAMAIRIGTSGDDPSELCDEAGSALPPAGLAALSEPPPEPWPGLPCLPAPPSVAEPDPPPDFEDGLPAEDPLPGEPPELLLPVAAPPFFLEECAEDSGWVGIGCLPVAVGGASEYSMPLESA